MQIFSMIFQYLLFFLILIIVDCQSKYKDDSKLLNEENYHDIIINLHAELDENNDGHIDEIEVKEFAKDKDIFKSKEEPNMHSKIISRDSLWKQWKHSNEYLWTKDIVVLWLIYEVGLPKYSETFTNFNVNGSTIPRLALPDHSYLKDVLKITNTDDCIIIAFKAKYLILFGASKDFQKKFPIKDIMAYSIISNLHSQLDDDKDGGVDATEANEFVRDELKHISDVDRAQIFNKDDNHISKEELWSNWKSSEVYNWTVDDVIDWLCNHVELCEHSAAFNNQKIDGSMIPKLSVLAQSDMSFLSKDLKIRNPVHRKKIILKATDLILFGTPKKTHSRAKDSILVTLLLLTIGGCWLAYVQNKYSKKQIHDLQEKMKQLGLAEDSLLNLQNKLDKAEQLTDKVNNEKQEIEERLRSEIEKYKEDLNRTESSEDLKSKGSTYEEMCDHKCHLYSDCDTLSYPDHLKTLLQITYELENNYYFHKRMVAMQQKETVKEMYDKMRKKKGAVMGAFRIAHSNIFDDVEKHLIDARTAMDQVKADLLERTQRWKAIEKITNFKLIPTPGLSKLKVDLANTKSSDVTGNYKRHSLISIANNISPLVNTSNATNAATNVNNAYNIPNTLTSSCSTSLLSSSATSNGIAPMFSLSSIKPSHPKTPNIPSSLSSQSVSTDINQLIYPHYHHYHPPQNKDETTRPKSLLLMPLTTSDSNCANVTSLVPPVDGIIQIAAGDNIGGTVISPINPSKSTTKLTKVWSVSDNLAHLYTSQSPCCGMPHCPQQSQQNMLYYKKDASSEKVRPFAFRWLKKLKKQ